MEQRFGTRAEYARYAGLSRARVTQLADENLLVEVETGDGVKVDFAATDKLREEYNSRPDAGPGKPPSEFTKARTLLTTAKAKHALLQTQIKEGSVIDREASQAAFIGIMHEFGNKIRAWPVGKAAEIALMDDPDEILELILKQQDKAIDEAIRAARNETFWR